MLIYYFSIVEGEYMRSLWSQLEGLVQALAIILGKPNCILKPTSPFLLQYYILYLICLHSFGHNSWLSFLTSY